MNFKGHAQITQGYYGMPIEPVKIIVLSIKRPHLMTKIRDKERQGSFGVKFCFH